MVQPYVSKAQEAGLLTGCQVDVGDVEAEITRYDMAVILRAAAKKLGAAEKAAEQSQVTDYLDIPTRYADAVLAVYGTGLIQGDQNGNFNGQNTMTRQEVATVMDRLIGLKPNGVTDPTPDETEPPAEPEMGTVNLGGWIRYGIQDDPNGRGTGVNNLPFEVRYTEDNGATYTVLAKGTTLDKYNGTWPIGSVDLSLQAERTIFDESIMKDSLGSKGRIYISAETTIDGQKYATQDRRTDGHAMIVPITDDFIEVELVPPDRGETMEIDLQGSVEARIFKTNENGHQEIHYYSYHDEPFLGRHILTNSTVKIYYDRQQEGFPPVLIAETTADGGSLGNITIDTAYYCPTGKCYFLDVEAVVDGQLCTDHREPKYYSMYDLTEATMTPGWILESEEVWNWRNGG